MNKLFQKALNKLKELDLPEDEYAIYGSGPLAIREIREAQDLDIVVTEDLYNELSKKYKEKKPGNIVIDNIDIYSSSESFIDNPEEVIKQAEDIQGFRFILLKDLVKWKRKLGREKDLNDIKLIQEYLEKQHF